MKPFEMTEEFHQTFDNSRPEIPQAFSQEKASFRAGFKAEELVEFLYATSESNEDFDGLVANLHEAVDRAKAKVLAKSKHEDTLTEQVDALTDLLYFTYGSFTLLGVDPQPIMEIVHQANMKKVFPDGLPHYHPVTHKVMKPDDWEEKYAPEGKIKAEIQRQIKEKTQKNKTNLQ